MMIELIWMPIAAVLLGGIVAAFRAPGAGLQSVFHHFTAGVVFAAVAMELLPELTRERRIAPLVIGFVVGVGLMLLVRRLAATMESSEAGRRNPTGLVVAVGVDVLIDGFLVGVSFAAGQQQGMLITLALTMELLFLGLSTSASLSKGGASLGRIVAIVVLLAGLVLIGATLGSFLSTGLVGDELVLVLAFATAALLYLVTEELLVEAHELPDSSLATAMFFAGFLILVVIEMAAHA